MLGYPSVMLTIEASRTSADVFLIVYTNCRGAAGFPEHVTTSLTSMTSSNNIMAMCSYFTLLVA